MDIAIPVPTHKVFTYRIPPQLIGCVKRGSRVVVPFGRRRMTGYALSFRRSFPARLRLKEIAALVDQEPLLGEKLLELAGWMSDYYVHPIGEVLRAILPAGVKGKGRMAAEDETVGKFPPEREFPELNEDQRHAFETVRSSLVSCEPGRFLLHGVTGSGKTEVYLRCIGEALKAGKSALVLIPEIALIPQTTARFRRRFGRDVAVLHSRLTGARRCAIWTGAAEGEIRIVIGARSAAFVPLKNLGIVVVDEEQDPSYKQEEKPHYNAVAVAMFRSGNEGAVLLLGSATPSLEIYEAGRGGDLTHLKLRVRPGGGVMPDIEIVDMRGKKGIFSDDLLDSLEACVGKGGQAVILINRRGHSNFVQCRKCGWISRCPSCSISLTYHSRGHRLICHYCGHRKAPPETCPECGSYKITHRGVGTQRIEMELMNLIPGLKVARMDLDTTAGRRGHLDVLESFSRGDKNVLLGTQMVAKGHHYPAVTLVGVLHADAGLHFPDFRAAEGAFRLLTQAAGRAGRGGRKGRVIIQAYAPDHFIYDYLAGHDYEGFADRELSLRRELRYPPFGPLMLFTVSSPSRDRAEKGSEFAAESLRRLLFRKEFEVLGPTPAVVERLRGRYRMQILVKGALSKEERREAVSKAVESISSLHRTEIQWNVDPVGLS